MLPPAAPHIYRFPFRFFFSFSVLRTFNGLMKNRSISFGSIVALLVLAALPAAGADTVAVEKTLRELNAKWSDAAASGDLEKVVSYYTEDAVVMPPNAPAATTKEAIRKTWSEMFNIPGFKISWKSTRVEVAASGDMGITSGTYEVTITPADGGKPVQDNGKFLVVWQKQADGTWKSSLDMWNSDLPAPATTENH